MPKTQKRLILLYSHPIQYFAPLFKAMQDSGHFELLVCYCSTLGVKKQMDKEFGVALEWDIPLLEGYNYQFLKNYSLSKKPRGKFWNLFNPGIIKLLWKSPKSYVFVHGWNYSTHILTIILAKLFGHKTCLRAESPLSHEFSRGKFKLILRRIIFKNLLFPLVDYCLYIGKENKAFYQHYGVEEQKLIFTPYAVDNTRFKQSYSQLKYKKQNLREAYQIPEDKIVILYSGKYIDKKRPMDLLQAYHLLNHPDTFLVFMGEGSLRAEMEAFILEKKLKNISLTGFINQSEVVNFYALADIFVMCSQEGETWGLSTNEAMNFCLPVILSDLTGSSSDLIKEAGNGYVYRTGDVQELTKKLKLLIEASPETRNLMGAHSKLIIQDFSYKRIIEELSTCLE